MLTKELKDLSRSEKLILINDLWDDVSESSDDLQLSAELKEKLDQRYESYLKNPESGVSWSDFKSQIRV